MSWRLVCLCAGVVLSAACQPAKNARVRVDVSALQSALGSVELSRLELRVEAPDLAEPIVVPVGDDGHFTVTVPAGSLRHFILDAMVLVGDEEVPAYYAERTISIEPSSESDLVLLAHPVGLLDVEIVTIDDTAVPDDVTATLVPSDAPWFSAAKTTGSRMKLMAPVGNNSVSAAFTIGDAAYATLPTQVFDVQHAAITKATVYALKKNDRCREDAPEALAALGPTCLAVSATVRGLGDGPTVTIASAGEEIVAGDGPHTFRTGVEAGSSYNVSVVSTSSASVSCSVTNGKGVASEDEPPLAVVTCVAPFKLVVRGLRGGLSAPLVVNVAGETTMVSADGEFALTTTNAMTPNVVLTQPGASPVDAFHCVSNLLPAMIDVRCMGEVRPMYPSYSNWLNYVTRGTSDVCANDLMIPCEHSAERREAHVYDVASCTDLTADDSEGALTWMCEPSGDHVRLRSVDLNPGHGLSSVIDFASCTTEDGLCAFKPMALVVTEGAAQRASGLSTWWQNSIVRNDVGPFAPTGVTGAIMVAGAVGPTALGPVLSIPNVAVVLMPQTVGTVQPFFVQGTETWLEGGALGATGLVQAIDMFIEIDSPRVTIRNMEISGGPVFVGETFFSTLVDLKIRDSLSYGLRLGFESGDARAEGVSVKRLSIQNVAFAGIYVEALTSSLIEDVRVAYAEYGIHFADSVKINERLRVRRVFVSNVNDDAIFVSNLQRSSLVDISAVDNVGGVHLAIPSKSIFLANVTAAHRFAEQIVIEGQDNVVQNVLAVNGEAGILANGATNVALRDFAAFGVTGPLLGMYMPIKPPQIRGIAGYHPAPDFLCGGGSFAPTGCTQTGTDGSSDWPSSGPSGICDARLTTLGLSSPFTGFVSSESTNPVFVPGDAQTGLGVSGAPSSAFAYTQFQDPRRSWIKNTNQDSYPNVSHRGGCSIPERCSIFEWHTKAGGPLHDILSVPGSVDVAQVVQLRDAMSLGVTQCDAFPGTVIDNVTFAPQGVCVSAYLQGAVEIDDDGIGLDNGLCEAGDDCLVPSNLGADQGEGPLVNVGSAQVDTGVAQLFRFTKTGY